MAANAPEIRVNLQSIAETLETVVSVLENQIYFNRDNAAIVERLNKGFELEKVCKNQAYDFILTERLLNRFKLFCSCYPVSTYYKKRAVILSASKAQRKAVTIKLPPFLLSCLQLLNINPVRQSRVYHFLFFCQHFGGVDRCNIIEDIKPSEIAYNARLSVGVAPVACALVPLAIYVRF